MLRCFLHLLLILCLSACGNKASTDDPPRLPPQYYYYPKANVYFDSANKEYVFLGNHSGAWVLQKQIPAAMNALMDRSVLLDSVAEPVWRNNENHKLVYSAVLYASPTDTIEKIEVKPLPTPDTVEKRKERKGIRGFFGRLFGKKKKDQEKRED